MSDLTDLQKRALEIRDSYDAVNAAKGRKAWSHRDRVMGFAVDVGELMELVMAKDGIRNGEDVDVKLAHELSDCLWSILVIASDYDVDLETEFAKTMNELKERLAGGDK